MKKLSELVKKSSIALNDYVPIIDSEATADVDKNKTTLFSTILNYFKQDMIANSQTVTEPGLKALDAVQANPNVSGSLAEIAATLNGLSSQTGMTPYTAYDLNALFSAQGLDKVVFFRYAAGATGAPTTTKAGIGLSYANSNRSYGWQFVITNGAVWLREYSPNAWKNWINVLGKFFGGIISIPANADLNTYTTPGEHYVETNAIAATIQNIPVAVAGRLTVEYGVSYVDSTLYIRQTYTPHSSAIFNQVTYVRASSNAGSTWSEWQMVGAQLFSSNNTAIVSVPSGSWTEIYRASNVPAGIYEITFSGLFGTAPAGMRSIQFNNVAVGGTPSWSTSFGRRTQTQLPVTNGNTALTLTRVLRTTGVQDIVFAIYHTAGANIGCSAGVDILRLA